MPRNKKPRSLAGVFPFIYIAYALVHFTVVVQRSVGLQSEGLQLDGVQHCVVQDLAFFTFFGLLSIAKALVAKVQTIAIIIILFIIVILK